MNATIPLLVSTAVTLLAPRGAAQEALPPNARRPVDVSIEGLGEAKRGAPGDAARAGRPALQVGPATLLGCARSVLDRATGACLIASSSPTSGALLPYPGIDSVFTPPAFVGGGERNQAVGALSAVAGGYENTAAGIFTTVAGGGENTATGSFSTIAGGLRNTADATSATVGGGDYNTASQHATVAGGRANRAYGTSSTVPGGFMNTAIGYGSFAAGVRATAVHDGAFVWGDSRFSPLGKPSSRRDQFSVYCSGGARFFTNDAAETGVLLAPGASTWTMVSDRDAKENVEPVDARAVLARVAELPLATWNYKDQPDCVRHMGPMAQDFHAAFGLGLGETTIDAIDPNGVALAAIQGLNEVVREKDAEIEALRARVARLETLALAAAGE